jgi:hypothetical protein
MTRPLRRKWAVSSSSTAAVLAVSVSPSRAPRVKALYPVYTSDRYRYKSRLTVRLSRRFASRLVKGGPEALPLTRDP